MAEPLDERLKFSIAFIRGMGVLFGVFFAGLAIMMFAGAVYQFLDGKSASIWAPLLVLLPLCIVGAVLVLRVGFLAPVEISDANVTVRGDFRTKRIPLADIVDVKIVPGSSLLVPWKVPALCLRDGREIPVQYLRVLGRTGGTPVEAFVSAIRDRPQPLSRE